MIDSPSSSRALFGDLWIGWLCHAGHYALGLLPWCPIDALLCVDDSPVNDLIDRHEGVRVHSLERSAGRRMPASDATANDILGACHDQLAAELDRARGRRRLLAASIASPALAAFAEQTGSEYIGNPPALAAWLGDKRQLHAAIADLQLPRNEGRWARLGTTAYGELAAELGPRLVAQLPRGSAGSGTAFIDSPETLAAAAARFGDALAWLAPDRGDLSLNINALALPRETIVSWPSVQLEGLALARARRGMYCGNDFAAASELPRATLDLVMEHTERLGRWLARHGYRGLFGLDFVIDRATATPLIVDLNPRWQGSTTLLTLAEDKANRLPLAVADLAWRCGVLGEDEIWRRADAFRAPVSASQVSLRCDGASWWQVGAALAPGVYAGESPPLRFLRHGLRLRDVESPSEVLVTGGLPRSGALLAPASQVVRFSSERSVMDLSRHRPHPWADALTECLYASLRLEPAGEPSVT